MSLQFLISRSKSNSKNIATRRHNGNVIICIIASVNVVAGPAPAVKVVNRNPLIPYEQLNEPFLRPVKILLATTFGSRSPELSAIALVSSGF